MKFEDLGLAAPVLKALNGEGYTIPTPIQQQAIPPVLEGVDLLGIAQTGTGKTAAFALPILTRLTNDNREPMRKGCRVLVLSPTRELASQIAESFRVYGRYLGVKVAVVFGGVDIRKQIQTLSRGVDVVVATPGRLLDHVGQKTIDLSGTEIFVLDEADQMLDMGFVKPIRRIAGCLSKNRQNLFFSATMPTEIAGLADDLLNKPVKVSVTPISKTADRIEQRVIFVEAPKKRALLVELFGNAELERTLVFTRTKRGADRVASHLEAAGIAAAAIHGNKSQRQRERALDSFKVGKTRVLVATDIAARGIDIDAVSHVVNFDLPEVPEAYVHRIGRTARAGASGRAISFCDNAERDLLRAVEKLTRQSIPTEDRRSDKSLVATKEAPRERGDRGDRGDRGGRGGPGRPSDNNRNRPRRREDNDRAAAPADFGGERHRQRDDRPAAAIVDRQDRRARDERVAAPAGEGARPQRNDRSTPARDASPHSRSRGERPAWAEASPRSDQPGHRNGGNRNDGGKHSGGGNAAPKRRPGPGGSKPKAPRPVSYGADY
ncbi:MAG: DEAD/DEAH box helicase [Alphaproteobacteria bacterium]|nr:DEAD/DEAH box helicase [Alphaproteobacteria bacterium]